MLNTRILNEKLLKKEGDRKKVVEKKQQHPYYQKEGAFNRGALPTVCICLSESILSIHQWSYCWQVLRKRTYGNISLYRIGFCPPKSYPIKTITQRKNIISPL
jgi:hypothetical protein